MDDLEFDAAPSREPLAAAEDVWVPARERAPPPMDHEPGWKESAFTWEMGLFILERIEAGETVKAITADPRMPSYATVFRWTHVHEEFGELYRKLRQRLCADEVWVDAKKAEARAWRYHHERRLAGKPERRWRSGKPSSYTPERAEAVCEMIREGASMSEVVRTPGMPSAKVVYRWLRQQPDFQLAYVDACSFREFMLHELAIDMALEATPANFKTVKARVAALDERAGRVVPKKYRALPQTRSGQAEP